MANLVKYNRRQFIKTSGIATGGLLIPFSMFGCKRKEGREAAISLKPNAFLRIGEDDTVTVILSHCEMGQGVWTALPMLIAEELDADWENIKAEHAPAAIEYYHTIYATQRTGGSSSMLSEYDRYRMAGASARHVLVRAAADRYRVDPSECRTENGYVIVKDKRLRYGELVNEAAKLEVPVEVPLKDTSEWKIIGKTKKRLDTPEKINGKAIFGLDVQLPGALTALVARNPLEGAKVKSYDKEATMGIPGVRQVVAISTGVAVLADHFWAAKKGRDALNVQWDLGPNAGFDSEALMKEFKERADKGGLIAVEEGNPSGTFAKSAKTVEAEYYQPFIAHAPMETLNVTVKLSPDKCEIWTGTQTQTDDQKAASEITGLPIEKVFIQTVLLGGSFGRRNITRSDFVREAVEIAKVSGKVVKTVWTREDDIQGGMYRPAFLHRFKVGLDKTGKPIAWDQISVGQSVMTGGPFEQLAVVNGVDAFSIEGMQDAPHVKAIRNKKIALNTPVWPVTIDNWRAVGLSHTVFAMESLSDEMALAAGTDPLEYRYMLCKDNPRLAGVLKLAAEKSGWGEPLPEGRGRGIAAFPAVGSYSAIVAEVSVTDAGKVKIHKVTCAIDCGIVINPDGVVTQMESSVIHGMSAALYNEITFKNGMVQQNNFYDYRSMRMNESPDEINTYIVPSTEKPGGVGESAVSQAIPALTNAIYAATGKRIRSLPVYNHKLA